MKLKIIFSILLIASLILISVDTAAAAKYGNSDKECRGICDQLRDRSCQVPVENCGEDCIPVGDEYKYRYGQNR